MSASARKVVARYLSAAASLDQKVRSAANAALIKAGMDGNGRFRSPGMALSRISEVLSSHGIEWGEVIQSFPLKQSQGRMLIDLALSNPADSFSPTDLNNAALAFQWYQLGNGQYEVVAYLS